MRGVIIKMDIREMGCELVQGVKMAQDNIYFCSLFNDPFQQFRLYSVE
jgi:hypothetical protein